MNMKTTTGLKMPYTWKEIAETLYRGAKESTGIPVSSVRCCRLAHWVHDILVCGYDTDRIQLSNCIIPSSVQADHITISSGLPKVDMVDCFQSLSIPWMRLQYSLTPWILPKVLVWVPISPWGQYHALVRWFTSQLNLNSCPFVILAHYNELEWVCKDKASWLVY